jgi:uncharacterized protein YciU (UPF0263 family)
MPKSSFEKALDKHNREAKKRANEDKRQANKQAFETALRERAKLIVEGQPVVNGLRIMDGDSEQLLDFLLEHYDGSENNCVRGTMSIVPENLQNSFSLELEKLQMYGVVSNVRFWLSGWEVYLSSQGKSYFDNKKISETLNHTVNGVVPVRKRYDVFLSHASSDKLDYTDSLAVALRKLGIKIFYDTDEIAWGDDWKKDILNGVSQSEFAIVVISKNFFGREWTERELNEFLQMQNESGQKVILPLLHGLSFDDLKQNYPELEFIQSIKTDKSLEEITILLARELIKRYK